MKQFFGLLFVLVLLTLACGLGGASDSDEVPPPPAATQTEAAPTAPPTPRPTEPPAPTEPPPVPTVEPDAATAQDSLAAEPTSEEPTPQPPADALPVGLVTLTGGGLAVPGNSADVTQEGGAAGVTYQPNVAFILDGSGSMNADLPQAGQPKLAVAKQVLTDLIANVPPEINGALWIYGHRYPQEPQEESCKDIEQVFPLGPVDGPAYAQAVQAITAIGYTPIADSMQLAAEAMPVGETQVNSLILVSDGEETCGGDPCALAAALKQSEAAVTIHVVGYDVDEPTRAQLQCIADVSGGMYRDADSADSLLAALSDSLEIAQTDTILRLELLGPAEEQIDGRADFYQAGTDIYVGGTQAWQERTIAPGQYDVVIDTQPPVVYPNLEIIEGSSTIIRLTLGAFDLRGHDDQPTRPEIFLLDGTGTADLGWYGAESDLELYYTPAGTYRIQVENGGVSQPLTVEAGQVTPLALGALELLDMDGQAARPELWFYDETSGEEVGWYGSGSPEGVYPLVPGTYQLKMRDGGLMHNLEISGGQLTEVQIGALNLVRDGQPARPEFWLFDQTGSESVGWYGANDDAELFYVVPGEYKIVVRDGGVVNNVVINGGELAEVALGALEVVDASGQPARPELWFYDGASGDEVGWYGNGDPDGLYVLAPGLYWVRLRNGGQFESVRVEVDAVTTLELGQLAFDLSQWTEPDTNPEFKAFRQSDDAEVSWYSRGSDGPFYFVPDTYRLELKEGPVIADVVINPQAETVVTVPAP